MASHGRDPRISRLNKKFFLHHKDDHHVTTPSITAIDPISVHSDESVEWEPVVIYKTKKQRDASIKNSRRMKTEGIENPISHSGTDAPKHMMRLGLMNCMSTCFFPQESIDQFGISHFNACKRCHNCVAVGRITVSEFRDRYGGYCGCLDTY
jgi:hypothetical protein